ncbi:MAG: CpsB/CapC family capsule biosynthesis tyrosine phosphatase [Gemmataceae bacterium]|nr:protein tyrosine phosphatase [Gemmata sp.]MDW8197734.1 CpsB/CapC family capsule biosynthesis tyrosine phosphatase [Gemmataceae bacterium]
MSALADTHVHLLAGMDDGPPNAEIALAMCRMLVREGVTDAAAVAHQNRDYPDNHADRVYSSAVFLRAMLADKKIPLTVYPAAEVMLSWNTPLEWRAGELLSVGDHRQWLLVEMPHGDFLDVLPLAKSLTADGVRLIIAHAERYEPLLDNLELAQKWIAAGCLFQVTACALAEPRDERLESALKRWAQGGFIHLLGSDGHGIDQRRPQMRAGYRRLARWVGSTQADRIASEWGRAVLQGRPVEVPPPQPRRVSWFSRLFG